MAFIRPIFNAALLERLGKHRLRLTDGERRRLAKLGKGLGRKALQQVAPIAAPRAWVSVAGCAALALATGCAHHRVGRPPSEGEIAEINQSTGADRVSLTLHYIDPLHPCGGGTCVADGTRPVSDMPPFEIERIVSADNKQVTVVAQSGDVWRLDLSKVAGVTRRRHPTVGGALVGGSIALGLTGPLMLFLYESSGAWPDAPVTAAPASSPWPFIGTVAVFTAIGAVIGAVIGHHSLTSDTFEFGETGVSFGTSSFSR